MNPVAENDARAYLGLSGQQELTILDEKRLRSKKKKIVKSSKKMDRRVDRELTRRANSLL